MKFYYVNPSPERVVSALRALAAAGSLEQLRGRLTP
jgi:hypothetical protein